MAVGEGGSGGLVLTKRGLVDLLRMMGGAWTRMGWG